MILIRPDFQLWELVNIKYSDIDFNNKRIRVCGKGNKERIVYFGDYALDALKEYTATHKKNDLGYVFTNSKGDKITDIPTGMHVYMYI